MKQVVPFLLVGALVMPSVVRVDTLTHYRDGYTGLYEQLWYNHVPAARSTIDV